MKDAGLRLGVTASPIPHGRPRLKIMGKKTASRTPLLAFGLILALTVVNLLLVKQNLALRRQLSGAGRTAETPNALKAGETVAPIAGTDLNGRLFELKYQKEGRHHLLLYFSPSRPYCVQQAAQWREVLNKVDDGRVSISISSGLILSSLKEGRPRAEPSLSGIYLQCWS